MLRIGMLGLLSALTVAVLYLLAEGVRRPAGPPLSAPETGEGVAQRARNLDVTRTRKGLPALAVSAREALTYRDGHTELHDVAVTVYDESRGIIEISAPLAVSRERSSGGWSFRQGVVLRDESGMRVQVPEITYRASPPELHTDGEVRFAKGTIQGRARGLRYLVARRHLEFLSEVEITSSPRGSVLRRLRAESATLDPRSQVIRFSRYTAETLSAQQLSGTYLILLTDGREEAARVRALKSERGFRAELPAAAGGEEKDAPRILTGERLEMELDGGGRPLSAVAEGGVRLSNGDPNTGPRSLSCERMEARFTDGAISSLVARRSAHLHIPAEEDPAGEPASISAEAISAAFDSGGSGTMAELVAEGSVTASHGERTLEAPRLVYIPDGERWTLSGEEEGPAARLTTSDSSVSASRIELDRPSEVMVASGSVKTLYRAPRRRDDPPREEAGRLDASGFEGLFGSGEGALHAMADHLRLDTRERKARYTGNVRIWRGGGSIEARAVDYSERAGLVVADGDVVARIPVSAEEGGSAGTVTVSSESLRYDRMGMDALFEGGVLAAASGMRIQAERMHARGATLHGMTEMEATGSVRLRQGSVEGEADRMEADFLEDTFILYGQGRLASIEDQSSQQLVEGAVLTYQRSTGTIQVESESGGRTWITLRPKSERGESSDPQSPR